MMNMHLSTLKLQFRVDQRQRWAKAQHSFLRWQQKRGAEKVIMACIGIQ